MFKKPKQNDKRGIFAALDIGNSKVCCAIVRHEQQAQKNQNSEKERNSLRILGLGFHISKGIKGSNIIDLDALEDAILNAIHSAEQQAGETLSHVYVNLPSGSTQSHIIRRDMPLSGASVEHHHLKKMLTLHKDPALLQDHHVVHASIPPSPDLEALLTLGDAIGRILWIP